MDVLSCPSELTALDERLGKIVAMKYFGGMTEDEIADVLWISTRTVQCDWEKAPEQKNNARRRVRVFIGWR